jgi:lambda family phage tail tape measure protein
MKGFNAASLLNPWVALAAGITAATVALVKHSRKNAEFNKSVIAGETTNEEANDRLREMNDKVQELEDRLGKETNNRMIKALTRQLKTAKIAAGDLELAMKLASSYEVAGIKYDRMTGRAINAQMSYTPTDFADPDADSGSESTPMTEIELALRRQMRQALAEEDVFMQNHLQLALDTLAAEEETEDLLKRTNMLEQAKADFNLAQKKLVEDQNKELEAQGKLLQQAGRELADARFAVTLMSQQERQRIEINRQLADFAEKYAGAMSSEELANALRELRANLEEANSASFKFRQGLREVFDEAMNVAEAVGDVGVNAVNNLGDAFADFVTTGKANFTDFANSVLKDLARIFAKKALFQGLSLIPGVGSFLGLGGGGGGGSAGPNVDAIAAYMNADGNVFAKNKIVPYAMGGIVNKPTLFPMANGAGLMGEAGPEAIMPLRRGPNGRLGVESSGSIGNVVVNVDATGSSVQGNQPDASQLGKAIGQAVQAELIKQKRPGGLLTR